MLVDVKTMFLLLGLLYIILPITVFFLLKEYRNTAVNLWCGGGFIVALGMLVTAFRPVMEGRVSGVLVYTLPNTLMVIGYALRAQSLQIDIQKAVPILWVVAWILSFIVVFEVARNIIGVLEIRVMLAYTWIGASLLLLSKAAYEYEQKFSITQIRYIWVSYFLLAVTLLVRAFLVLIGYEQPLAFQNSMINNLVVFLGVLTVIYSNVAYVGVMFARAEKEIAASAQKNTKLLNALNRQSNIIKDLMRAQSLSVVGTYGSAVVHEILQPLTAMRFALENLKIHLLKNGEDKTTQDRIDAVDVSASRAISVIENLRNFIVEREVQIEAVSFNKMIQEVLEIISSRAKALDVDVCLQLSDQILVMADEHQLQRVLFNIVNNALDAVERNISSEDRRILIDAKYVQQRQFALIKVVDSGAGLQDKNQLEIFEWLSANSQKGMGIGLALSKILVESWRGHIAAYNADPKVDGLSGAVFELKLQSA